jgi:hypothetical protein
MPMALNEGIYKNQKPTTIIGLGNPKMIAPQKNPI